MANRQRQEGGDASTNVQAGRDVVVHEGPSVTEVRDIALDVFRSNFLDLRGEAAAVARERAEEITTRFLDQLHGRDPALLASAADPDMQRSIYVAQREYACSGEDDLQETLVDLLVDRADEETRSIQAIVLNEAIKVAPKLTESQRRAIAVVFLVRYTRWRGSGGVDELYEKCLRPQYVPLSTNIPRAMSAYLHIEYVGAGAVSIAETQFIELMRRKTIPWFTLGFTADEAPEPLGEYLRDPRVVIPCVRDPDRFQISAHAADDIPDLAGSHGLEELVDPMKEAFALGHMDPSEVQSEMFERVPDLEAIADAWKNTGLKNLTLTTVGLAIGHAYWQRVTGARSRLAGWIDD